ncbi:MAG: hypothetical protein R2932_30750 [Caldilineaceae bacterium]
MRSATLLPGTLAQGRLGPDLTAYFASRRATGAAPMRTRAATWPTGLLIPNRQTGNLMPATTLQERVGGVVRLSGNALSSR